MQKFITFYRLLIRYSTLILMLITVGVGSYVYLTWPRSYFELYCTSESDAGSPTVRSEQPSYLGQRFDYAYDCDRALLELSRGGGARQCPELGCRKIIE